MHLRCDVAMSLDGFLAPPDESTDWIVQDPSIDFEALYASYDYFIMGRKTYQTIAADPDNNPFKGRPKSSVVVISRTLDPQAHDDILVLQSGYIDLIRSLKEKDGGGVWLMGGGWLVAECLEAQLLDGLDIAIMPVLLGSGFKLFQGTGQEASRYELLLSRAEALDSGVLMTTYEVSYEDN